MLARRVVDSFPGRGATPAIVAEGGGVTTYAELFLKIHSHIEGLEVSGVLPGEVVAIEGTYSPDLIALFWALAASGNIVMPLNPQSPGRGEPYLTLAEVRHVFTPSGVAFHHETRPGGGTHPLLRAARDGGEGGLVLLSSGTEGKPKVVLHDLGRLLSKYHPPLKAMRTLLFLVFDHIAGLDTQFYTLAAGGCLVLENTRRPEAVCRAIADHKVEVLAATPSFLSLLLASEAYLRYDLGSLKVVAYGSEVMPSHLLARLAQVVPKARLIQKYGTTELGSPPSKTKEGGELFVRMGREGVETRIVDGILHIRTKTAMLGYLNAENPFDEDGWFNTGDMVEADGDWMRILGRRSEMINVGGEKVHPPQVEDVLLQMANVKTASVFGESNSLLGQIVVARLTTKVPQPLSELKQDVRRFCASRLAPYQVPVKIVLGEASEPTYRLKKTRPSS